jgi:hypothetical protein
MSPEEARKKAEELRLLAQTYKDPEARRIMNELSDRYLKFSQQLEAFDEDTRKRSR